MHGFELDRQDAEDRAPLRMRMSHTDDFRTGSQYTSMDRPLIGRRLCAVEIVAVQILHDQAILCHAARAYIGDGDESVCARDAHADMAVAVGDIFMIENMAGRNQLVRQFLQFPRVYFGHIFYPSSHARSSVCHSYSNFLSMRDLSDCQGERRSRIRLV